VSLYGGVFLGYICCKEGLSPNYEVTCLICDPLKRWDNQGVLCMSVILNATPNKASFQRSFCRQNLRIGLFSYEPRILSPNRHSARINRIQHLEAWVSCMATKLIKVTFAKEYCHFLEYKSSTTEIVGETTGRHYVQPLHPGSVDQRGHLFGESMTFIFIT
jgi:hypothetical protein